MSWVGRPPGGGRGNPLQCSHGNPLQCSHGNPLQCSCLEKPVDRGAWRAAVHAGAKSQTRLSMHTTNGKA